MKEQDFASSECEVEIRTLRDYADQPLHFDLLRPHVVVADPRLAAPGPNASSENTDCSRFTGAVWTKQSEDLAAIHVKR
jgi:hypothetical protein